jgi:CheY-like chemotaxis protein
MAEHPMKVSSEMPVRAGWAAVIRAAPGLAVVGEAADGEEAVALAAETHPDVVVMGTRTPAMNVITATERIRAAADPPKVIILSPPDQHEQFRDALRAGASGLLMRDVPPEQLLAAIPAVAAGYVLLAPYLAYQMIETSVAGGPSPAFDVGSLGAWGDPGPTRSAEADQLVFARDIHDVLGRTLAVINRKSELVARLLADQPDRARAELETVCALARRSIAEVRALAGGYRLGDLAAEIEGARSDLQVMGVQVEVSGTPGALPRSRRRSAGWRGRLPPTSFSTVTPSPARSRCGPGGGPSICGSSMTVPGSAARPPGPGSPVWRRGCAPSVARSHTARAPISPTASKPQRR